MPNTDHSPETDLFVTGAIAQITLNRPERRNSFTDPFMDSLLQSVETAVTTPGVRVIILSGGQDTFSVGGDLKAFAEGAFAPPHLTAQESAAVLRRQVRAVELLRASDKISIASIGGPCAGAGLSLAAACDLRVASETAVFRTAFLDAALASDYGGIWSLTRLLGESRAKELFLLGEKLTAARAREIGLVQAIVAPTDLEGATMRIAESLIAQSPGALSATKQLFATQDSDFGEALDTESLAQKELAYAADAREAARAFIERRTPKF